MEDTSTKSNVDPGDPAQGVPEGSNINLWGREHSCDVLAKIYIYMDAFCPCPEDLPEARSKDIGLKSLTEDISKPFDSVSAKWLLVITFMQVHNMRKIK